MPGYPRPSRIAAVPLEAIIASVQGELASHAAGGAEGAVAGGARGATEGLSVTGVTHDSTQVCPGDLYVAIRGGTRHGAQFAGAAVAAGAVAVLTDDAGARMAAQQSVTVPVLTVDDPRAVLGEVSARVYGDPTAHMLVIGLTGTAGKTSTAYLVNSGLTAAGHTTCLVGTVETRIGAEVIDSVRTTPEATDLHALLAVARQRGATASVMEVSSHALAYGRVGGVHFDVGGFTNFGQDHLDFHADLADYFAAKARLFDGRCRVEVLNLDDDAVRSLVRPTASTRDAARSASTRDAARSQRSPSITFSAAGNPAATWRAENITRSGFAQTFTAVHRDQGAVEVTVAMPGRHNVANALLALACLVAAGVPAKVAAEGIRACRGVPGRLELVGAADSTAGAPGAAGPWPVLGVVDYAHKPDAIAAALAALREVGGGRLVCVIGAGGDRDRGKRPLMGAAAARGADLVVVTDDNPRSEDPAAIRAEVLAGAAAAGTAIEVAGRRAAIDEAVRWARPGDVIAVLGKGHERGQEVAGRVTPFDDRVELAAALTQRFVAQVRA